MPGDPLASLYALQPQAGTHCLPRGTKNSPFAVGKDDALWVAILFFCAQKNMERPALHNYQPIVEVIK